MAPLLVVLAAAALTAAAAERLQHSAYVVVDAGSSGTRLHVFERDAAFEGGWRPLAKLTTNPGLSSLQSCAEVHAQLEGLMDRAGDALPAGPAPAAVLATAGLRLLPEQERTWRLECAAEALQTRGLESGPIRVLSGEDEAAMAFLTADAADPGVRPVGILDLGGASTQIAFASDHPELATELASGHSVYAASRLGCGINEARLGSGTCDDVAECRAETRDYVAGHALPQPPLPEGVQFYALDHLVKVARHYEPADGWDGAGSAAPDGPFPLSWGALEKRADEVCAVGDDDDGCFSLAYVSSLLQHYGFEPDRPVLALDELEGVDLSWSLGSVLFHSGGEGAPGGEEL